jgi:hypothetical protein
MEGYHTRSDDNLRVFLSTANSIFLVIFLVEMILKLTGLGLKQYLQDMWNCFDGLIVSFSIMPAVVTFFVGGQGSSVGSAATAARTFRIGRALRLIKRAKSLRLLFETLILSLPAMLNISGLFFLFLFVFAVLGVELFAFNCNSPSCGALVLNEHCNFRNWGNAMTTLFRMATFDSWPLIAYDVSLPEADICRDAAVRANMALQDQYANRCGSPGPAAGKIYCICFTILGAWVFLQLVVAVILDNFNSVFNQEDDSPLMQEDMQRFRAAWQKFDRHATGYIREGQLWDFLTLLGGMEMADPKRKKCVLIRAGGP